MSLQPLYTTSHHPEFSPNPFHRSWAEDSRVLFSNRPFTISSALTHGPQPWENEDIVGGFCSPAIYQRVAGDREIDMRHTCFEVEGGCKLSPDESPAHSRKYGKPENSPNACCGWRVCSTLRLSGLPGPCTNTRTYLTLPAIGDGRQFDVTVRTRALDMFLRSSHVLRMYQCYTQWGDVCDSWVGQARRSTDKREVPYRRVYFSSSCDARANLLRNVTARRCFAWSERQRTTGRTNLTNQCGSEHFNIDIIPKAGEFVHVDLSSHLFLFVAIGVQRLLLLSPLTPRPTCRSLPSLFFLLMLLSIVRFLLRGHPCGTGHTCTGRCSRRGGSWR